MTLHQKLQLAKSEEDVKDAYIKALGLKGYSKILSTYKPKKSGLKPKIPAGIPPTLCLHSSCITCRML